MDWQMRRKMVEPNNPGLSIGEQFKLLPISRSLFYYQPKGYTALNLMLRCQIDEQFLMAPFFGVRQTTWHLRNAGLRCQTHRSWELEAGSHSQPQALNRPRSLRHHHAAPEADQSVPDCCVTLRRASRAASSRPLPRPTGCGDPACASRWMPRAGSATISSSSGCEI